MSEQVVTVEDRVAQVDAGSKPKALRSDRHHLHSREDRLTCLDEAEHEAIPQPLDDAATMTTNDRPDGPVVRGEQLQGGTVTVRLGVCGEALKVGEHDHDLTLDIAGSVLVLVDCREHLEGIEPEGRQKGRALLCRTLQEALHHLPRRGGGERLAGRILDPSTIDEPHLDGAVRKLRVAAQQVSQRPHRATAHRGEAGHSPTAPRSRRQSVGVLIHPIDTTAGPGLRPSYRAHMLDAVSRGEVRVVDDVPGAFAAMVIEAFSQRMDDTFSLFTSGGATARRCYERLAADGAESIDWWAVDVYWGDERCVPANSPDSNQRLVREALLERVGAANAVYPMVCGDGASGYQIRVGALGGLDLVHLGLGPDGHTASLFPGSSALDADPGRLVTENLDPTGANPHPRMTLTLSGIARARLVVVTVEGEDKADALARVRAGDPTAPASHVRAPAGEVVWLVDPAAAGHAA